MISLPHRHFWRCGTTRSTIISGHLGHSRNTNNPPPYQTQPTGFWRDFSRAAASLNHQHEHPTDGEWRRICPPTCPPLRALAPPPRLRAKPASFCALCAVRPGPASAGAAWKKRCFKNCANLCTIVQPPSAIF